MRDADFAFGLDVFLDGFRSRLPVRAPRLTDPGQPSTASPFAASAAAIEPRARLASSGTWSRA